jgi:hypothetical protein
MLRALVRGLSTSAIELRVLQYGVTRDTLRDVLQEGEGWDLLHFSGHGLPGSLVLEKSDGWPDLISGSEVSDLLRQSGRRLKLVVLSSCLSAAASIKQTLSWLHIETAQRDGAAPAESAGARGQAPEAAPTVARVLVGALDCAVLAMRYAVEDEFAMVYARNIYDGLLRQKQNLPQATQIALNKALGGGSRAGALSVATPALFGVKAAALQLMPPRRTASGGFAAPETGLAFFPPQPERFVGRVAAMTEASSALAVERRSEFRTASTNATELANLLRVSGCLDDALGVVEQAIDYDRRAGFGPWTLLGDESQGLQIRLLRGEKDFVVRRVSELREQMKSLPDPPGENDTIVTAWNVRELILDIGRQTAQQLEQWQQALDFGAEISASEKSRGASELEQAQTLFNLCGPLLRLRRYDDSRATLLACRMVFERENSVRMIGKVLSVSADLEGRPIR